MEQIEAYGYFFESPEKALEKRSFTIDAPGTDEVIVKVAGCGLCHTDIGFISGNVGCKHELPLVLGHEVSGTVIAAGDSCKKLLDKQVIVPAVLPCGECDLCKCGRDSICQAQQMPGNDFNGGFASHLKVPGRFLCPLPEDLGTYKLEELSVIADAVSTPYQSLKRSNIREGDLAVIIGAGGIGIYMVQHAKNAGATVIAVDIDEKRLEVASRQGAKHTLLSQGLSERDIKGAIRNLVKTHQLPQNRWKIFETSGTVSGQMAAFSLLSYAGTIGIIGFSMEKLNIRLSNIMAFDADLFGNWGCSPRYYPELVNQVLSGKIMIADNVQVMPLSEINKAVAMFQKHELDKRVVLTP